MSDIKAILFDNDGTVADTIKPILTSFKYMLETVLGKCDDNDIEYFKSLVGLPSRDQFSKFTDDSAIVDEMIKTYRGHNDKIVHKMTTNFEGLPQVLEELDKQGFYMGIVTSKVHNVCIEGLKNLGIDKYFKYIQGPDDYKIVKPDPGVLTYACEQIGFKPEETMYVGDSKYDIQAGNGAGCKTCAVL